MIFHNYVLIFECKYNLSIMQLKLKPRHSRRMVNRTLAVKAVLFSIIFLLAIFLLDKINFPVPAKLIKQEISNDKIITLK